MAANSRYEGTRPRWGKPIRGRLLTAPPPTDPTFLLEDLEQCLTTLSVGVGGNASSELVKLRHVNPVASYSWIDAPVPTIVVPGSPRTWAGERPPVKQVPLDSGVQQIHHNATKMGNQSPMLPIFAAIDALHDDFPYKDLDLVTNRNGLRKLFRCVDGLNPHNENDFRIDVDMFGKTCLFTRREESTMIVGQNTGYGDEYLKATTRAPAGCEKMLDYHRIITYKFGGLKILLCFSAEACVEQKKNDDDLLASFSSLSIEDKAQETTKPKIPPPAGLNVEVTSPTSLVSQSDLVEVKTRSSYREVDWRDIYPQVYLSQTPWLYMARHTKGVFEPIEKISLTGEQMRPYAEIMEGSLGKLKNLLKTILKAVREQGEGVPLSLVYQSGKLSLWKRKEGSGKPLGEAIVSRFRS